MESTPINPPLDTVSHTKEDDTNREADTDAQNIDKSTFPEDKTEVT